MRNYSLATLEKMREKAYEKYCKETVKPHGNWDDGMRLSKLPSLSAWEKARTRLAELDEAIAKKKAEEKMAENNKDFTCYYIGQKYDKVMPGDGAVFELGGDNGFINIGFTNMTDEEIAAIHHGKLDIHLSVIEGLVFITASFGDQLILDMPFNAGLYPEFNIEDPAPNGYTVPIIAVDNKDNIIRALRVVGFDPEFSSKLYSFAKKQWEERIENFDERLQSVYDRYNPKDIIKFAIMKNNVEVKL